MELVERSSLWTKMKTSISDCRITFKESGMKGVIKKYGWKVFAIFFMYYLVRDVTLYILIPAAIAKGIWN
jgi:hypothetical protein